MVGFWVMLGPSCWLVFDWGEEKACWPPPMANIVVFMVAAAKPLWG